MAQKIELINSIIAQIAEYEYSSQIDTLAGDDIIFQLLKLKELCLDLKEEDLVGNVEEKNVVGQDASSLIMRQEVVSGCSENEYNFKFIRLIVPEIDTELLPGDELIIKFSFLNQPK